MDAIIGRAEVARQTFYNHFKSKETLFAEVIRGCFLEIIAPLNEQPDDLRASLKNFAHLYRLKALGPEGIASYRTLSEQAQRFPEPGREGSCAGRGGNDSAPGRLSGARQWRKGNCAMPTRVFAAELLLAMLVGRSVQLLFGVRRPPEDEALKVATVVDGFLRMFAPV